jgi:hypothetical protein
VIAAAAPAPRAARDQAREILSEGRFQEPSFPTPFKGFFEWLGEGIQPVLDAVGNLLGKLAGPLPGGRQGTAARRACRAGAGRDRRPVVA